MKPYRLSVLVGVLTVVWLAAPLSVVGEEAAAEEAGVDVTQLIETAKAKIEALQYAEATEILKQAVQADPENEFAKQMLQNAQALAEGKESGRSPQEIVEQIETERLIRIQLAKMEMENVRAKAVKLSQQGEYELAIAEFQRAQEILTWLAPQTDVAQYEDLIPAELARAEASLEKQKARDEEMKEKEAARVVADEQARQRRVEQQRIDDLMSRAKAMYARGNYKQAIDLSGEVIKSQSDHAGARALMRKSQRSLQIEYVRNMYAKKDYEDQAVVYSIDAMSIPATSYVSYPDNWEEIGKRAELLMRSTEEEDVEWKRIINDKLKTKVTFEFAETSIEEALRFLSALTGVSFVPDPEAIASIENPAITLRMDGVSLEAALDTITKMLGLGYLLDNESIFVTSPEKAKGESVMLFYDVSDLTVEIRDFRISTEAITLGGDDEDDEGLFGDEDEDEESAFTGAGLVEFIRNHIEPESWVEADFGD